MSGWRWTSTEHRSFRDETDISRPAVRKQSYVSTVARVDPDVDLTIEELAALRAAGAWYAKYHGPRVAELADDPSAYAERKREEFMTLVTSLRKLGFDMALPDALRPVERRAA